MRVLYIFYVIALLFANAYSALAQEQSCDYRAQALLNGTWHENGILNNTNKSNSIDIKSDIVYKSAGEKSKSIALFSLLFVSILLNIILIWKR